MIPKILLLFFILTQSASAATLAGRHVYIIHPGMDSVWGSYMLVVEREQEGEKESASFKLILPKETEDWSPQQGIEKSNVKLNSDGGLLVEADFMRPQTLVVTGFKVAGSEGRAPMTVTLPFDVAEFSIMALEGRVNIESERFESKGALDFSGKKYDTWTVEGASAGETLSLVVTGVPEGRKNYYILAFIFFALLIGVVAFFALRTRPKLAEGGDEFESVRV